jgi:hypothetical protein
LRERKAFTLPLGHSWPRWWLAASVVAHFIVLTALVESSMSWRLSLVPPAGAEGRATPSGATSQQLVFFLPTAPAPHGRGAGEGPGRVPGAAPVPEPLPPLPMAESGYAAPIRVRTGGGDSTAVATRGSGNGRGPRGVIDYTPQLGDGHPWVEPSGAPQTASRPIRLDSAVAIRMRALADSIEQHPPADPNANPYVSRPWTFKVGGKTYGIDAKGIHLGTFTIPTAVLAFLSLPQGNIDQARANQAFMAMRADMLRAAARAETEEDFREAVKAMRERKEKEHQEQEQQKQDHPQPVQP